MRALLYGGLERVELSRRARIRHKFLLDEYFDGLPIVSCLQHFLHLRLWNHYHAVLIPHDGVSRAHGHVATGDDIVACPGLHDGWALLGSGGVAPAHVHVHAWSVPDMIDDVSPKDVHRTRGAERRTQNAGQRHTSGRPNREGQAGVSMGGR